MSAGGGCAVRGSRSALGAGAPGLGAPQGENPQICTVLCYCGMGSSNKVGFSFSHPSFLPVPISGTPPRVQRTNSGQKSPTWHGEPLFPGYATSTALRLQGVVCGSLRGHIEHRNRRLAVAPRPVAVPAGPPGTPEERRAREERRGIAWLVFRACCLGAVSGLICFFL